MADNDPLDLTALDPEQDPGRWRMFVEATLLRVEDVLAARPLDPLTLIASWSRLVTATAAVLVFLLVPVELMLERREAGSEQLEVLVRLSTRTALGEGAPSGAELSRALGLGALP